MKKEAKQKIDRSQLRRKFLVLFLKRLDMLPSENLVKLSAIDLYRLRDKALKEKLSLQEIGRIFIHLNQNRGCKFPQKTDKYKNETPHDITTEDSYFSAITQRSQYLKDHHLTVGQQIYKEFFSHSNGDFQKKNTGNINKYIYPRQDYINEFNAIWNFQSKNFYNEILTEANLLKIRDGIIYNHRNLVLENKALNFCALDSRIINIEHREITIGAKVAAKSNPLAQICKLWESINHLSIKYSDGKPRTISLQEKLKLFNYLNFNEKLTIKDIRTLLNVKNIRSSQHVEKIGLSGNQTLLKIRTALGEADIDSEKVRRLTQFNFDYSSVSLNNNIIHAISSFQVKSKSPRFSIIDNEILDNVSGENVTLFSIETNIEKEPLYIIWHLLYSINDSKELKNAFRKNTVLLKLGLTEIAIERLSELVFNNAEYAKISVKAMRNIVPYLQNGYTYAEAVALAGYDNCN